MGYDNVARASSMVKSIDVTPASVALARAEGCDVCALTKHCARPFPSCAPHTTRPLQLVRTDLCGPMPVQSLGGKQYWLTVLDDYSGYADVFAPRTKGEATG
jgi:hypothetical protein